MTFWLGNHASFEDFQARQARLDGSVAAGTAGTPPTPELFQLFGNVAVVDVSGPLTNSDSFLNELFGLTSYQRIRSSLMEAASHPDVGHIVMNIDSPGGAVSGMADVATLVRRLNKAIPVTAYTNGMMASAAYAIGSAAGRVFSSPSATLGSIGVISTLMNQHGKLTKEGIEPVVVRSGQKKALANPYEAMTDEARAEMQAQADHLHQWFIEMVAEHRGMSIPSLQTVADGRELIGSQAVAAGLSDGLTSLDELVGGLQAAFESSQRTDPMPKRKLLTERQVSLIAEGVAPEAALEVLAPETPEIPETSEVPEAPIEVAVEAAAPAPVPSDLMVYLQSELSARTVELTALTLKVAEQERELSAYRAHDGAMRSIVASSIQRMQVGLGGKAMDLTKLSTEALLSQHAQVSEQFSQIFPVGGVAALASEKEEEAPLSLKPVERAALRAVKTK